MKTRDFNKMIKNLYDSQNKTYKINDIEKIKSDYMVGKICLSEKQLEKVCNLGNGHGGCCFKYKK